MSEERLSPESRADLLGLARGTLEAHFRGQPPPRLASDRAEAFGQPRGLFVTLRKDGQLRGCIGTLAPTGDLTRCVSEYALRAALSADRQDRPRIERRLTIPMREPVDSLNAAVATALLLYSPSLRRVRVAEEA